MVPFHAARRVASRVAATAASAIRSRHTFQYGGYGVPNHQHFRFQRVDEAHPVGLLFCIPFFGFFISQVYAGIASTFVDVAFPADMKTDGRALGDLAGSISGASPAETKEQLGTDVQREIETRQRLREQERERKQRKRDKRERRARQEEDVLNAASTAGQGGGSTPDGYYIESVTSPSPHQHLVDTKTFCLPFRQFYWAAVSAPAGGDTVGKDRRIRFFLGSEGTRQAFAELIPLGHIEEQLADFPILVKRTQPGTDDPAVKNRVLWFRIRATRDKTPTIVGADQELEAEETLARNEFFVHELKAKFTEWRRTHQLPIEEGVLT